MEPGTPERRWPAVVIALLLVVVAALGFLVYRLELRARATEAQLAALSTQAAQSAADARQAAARAVAAESASLKAAEGREAAEARTEAAEQKTEGAEKAAEAARQEADTARQDAEKAKAEAEAVRRKAQAEVGRLEAALGQIGETRRTALGLVMNLGSDRLRFEFDKAELRASDKELLSRIAGILMTSSDYTVSVNGHTDDVGSEAYNKKLSERRARVVHDYLVQAGLSPDILSVEGHGKALPLVPGTTDAARAKNRRVELGIVNTQIRYGL
jgi:outer membrane protein OmpA-like peptidoglycan-associated protein